MANKPIVMSKLRKVLQLYLKGRSKQFIGKYLSISRNTIKKYLRQFSKLGLCADELDQLSDLELEKLFVESPVVGPSERQASMYKFFPYMEKELKKTGVTRQLMWLEYIEKHPDGLRSTADSTPKCNALVKITQVLDSPYNCSLTDISLPPWSECKRNLYRNRSHSPQAK